jgi:hypothetical protein
LPVGIEEEEIKSPEVGCRRNLPDAIEPLEFAVEQLGGLEIVIRPTALAQGKEDGEIRDIGDTGDQDTLALEEGAEAGQERPGVAEMFEDTTVADIENAIRVWWDECRDVGPFTIVVAGRLRAGCLKGSQGKRVHFAHPEHSACHRGVAGIRGPIQRTRGGTRQNLPAKRTVELGLPSRNPRHSRHRLPSSRSQDASAIGAWTRVRGTRKPTATTAASSQGE